MVWSLLSIALVILGVLIWFNIPYSPMKSEYAKLISDHSKNIRPSDEKFSEEDIEGLPQPLQKYFHYCRYIGKPKMASMKAEFNDVDFVQASKKLKIQYTVDSFVAEPVRFALIDSSVMEIPFQGLDSYANGVGSMKGQIAKLITLFNEKGEAMNKACLVTYLSECFLMPRAMLQPFINWQNIDEHHVKGTISCYGTSASGIFTFNDLGQIVSFTTEDREYNDSKGNIRKAKWSAILENYKEIDGIKYPTVLRAVWHLEEGDLEYFHGCNMKIRYDVRA